MTHSSLVRPGHPTPHGIVSGGFLRSITGALMGNPAAPLEVTIDHHPDPGDAHPVAPRPVLKFVAQAVPGSDTELELLLRKRLRFLALLLGSVFASLAIVLLPMDLFWFLRRQTDLEWGHWVALAMSWTFLLTYGAIAGVCHGGPRSLSRGCARSRSVCSDYSCST